MLLLMAASRRLNHHCFHYFIAFDPHNAFLGSSPERLWRKGHHCVPKRWRGPSPMIQMIPGLPLGDWLMNDDKNQRENMLVVEDICQRCSSNYAGCVAAANCSTA
jgi:menaquinone-specific isochorismate synthase